MGNNVTAPSAHGPKTSIFAELYASQKYWDLTITCKGRHFKVHRSVVCLQSKVLAAACDGNFSEAHSRVIDLDDCEPDIVARMIKFLYTDDDDDSQDDEKAPTAVESTLSHTSGKPPTPPNISTGLGSATGSSEPFLVNVKVYILGDRYDIQPLKDKATTKYHQAGQAIPFRSSSFTHSLELLYKQTLETDRQLKDVAVEVAEEHTSDLMARNEFAVLCKANGEIAFDVYRAISSRPAPSTNPSTPATRKCPWHFSTNCVTSIDSYSHMCTIKKAYFS